MKSETLLLSILFASAACIIAATGSVYAEEISAANTSRYVCNGKWDWTVYIQSTPEVINDVKHVKYQLHPTFPDPAREVDSLGDARYPFGLTCRGWGEFKIGVEVTFEDGHIQHLDHMLVFESPPVSEPLPITAGNVATESKPGRWKWTVFIQSTDEVLEQIECVEYNLHPSYSEPVRDICERGEGARAFALSEASRKSFEIKIRIFLKDGSVQTLTHQLKF
ncbi:MAG: hypothetical protein JSU69_06250 [Candidatus Zixiibacteriota bacterium]|nr:MAG: hypothetical protein JSU69_06250 [candidate division Zixibacteria bacterium]